MGQGAPKMRSGLSYFVDSLWRIGFLSSYLVNLCMLNGCEVMRFQTSASIVIAANGFVVFART
jgi:hypothetical protein